MVLIIIYLLESNREEKRQIRIDYQNYWETYYHQPDFHYRGGIDFVLQRIRMTKGERQYMRTNGNSFFQIFDCISLCNTENFIMTGWKGNCERNVVFFNLNNSDDRNIIFLQSSRSWIHWNTIIGKIKIDISESRNTLEIISTVYGYGNDIILEFSHFQINVNCHFLP